MRHDVADAPVAGDRRALPVRGREAAEEIDELAVEWREEVRRVDGRERLQVVAPIYRNDLISHSPRSRRASSLKEWFVSYHFTSLGSLAVCR